MSSFFQLAELFSAHFIAGKKERKTSIHLARIQQQRGEDLKGYVRRFNHETVLIPDLQDGVATPPSSMDYSPAGLSFP